MFIKQRARERTAPVVSCNASLICKNQTLFFFQSTGNFFVFSFSPRWARDRDFFFPERSERIFFFGERALEDFFGPGQWPIVFFDHCGSLLSSLDRTPSQNIPPIKSFVGFRLVLLVMIGDAIRGAKRTWRFVNGFFSLQLGFFFIASLGFFFSLFRQDGSLGSRDFFFQEVREEIFFGKQAWRVFLTWPTKDCFLILLGYS